MNEFDRGIDGIGRNTGANAWPAPKQKGVPQASHVQALGPTDCTSAPPSHPLSESCLTRARVLAVTLSGQAYAQLAPFVIPVYIQQLLTVRCLRSPSRGRRFAGR